MKDQTIPHDCYESLIRESEMLRCIEKVALNESDEVIARVVKDILIVDEM